MLSKYFAIAAVLATASCAAWPSPATPARPGAPADAEAVARLATSPEPEVRNVVFLLADGAGVSYWSAAAHARERPAFAAMPVVGLVDTRTARHRVPDSAATASAYAIGELVMNRVISMVGCPQPEPRDPVSDPPPGCEPVESWFTIARDRGMATGAVTTTRIVDGSPAAFVANSPSRYYYFEIADQFAKAGLDVMLGGGRGFFEPQHRPDGRDLLGSLCARSVCAMTAAELRAYAPDDRPLVGLFVEDDMGSVAERPVSLPEMTRAALTKLARDPDGFVVLIETEGTDNAGHANDSLESITAEMLEFDDAIAVALRFAEESPGTLVIATADHETGGLALGQTESPDSLAGVYTTGGHTASMVPLFAYGAGAERFAGVRTNVEIGRLLKDIVAGR